MALDAREHVLGDRHELGGHRERVEQVVLERRLLADRDGIGGLDDDGPRIDAARALAQVAADLAHAERGERRVVLAREIADR